MVPVVKVGLSLYCSLVELVKYYTIELHYLIR